MFERTFSPRYKRNRPTGVQRARWRRLIQSQGFEVVSVEQTVAQLFSPGDMARARKELFRRAADAAVYERKDIVQRRFQKLSKPVRVHSTSFRSADGAISVILKVAPSNSFPALGTDVWTASRLRLPAGFVTVRGSDYERIRTLTEDLLRQR